MIKQRFALVVIEEVGPAIEVPKNMKPMLEEYQRIVHDEFLDEMQPMRDIQHYIDLIYGVSDEHDFITFSCLYLSIICL